MGTEVTATPYIDDLNAAWPIGTTDDRSVADDHLRFIKAALKNSFPGITGAMTPTHTQINNAVEALFGATGVTATLNGITYFNSFVILGQDAPCRMVSKDVVWSAAQTLNFSTSALKTLTASGNFTSISTSNRADGAMMVVRFYAGATRAFANSGGWASWKWLGTKPTTIAAGKYGLLCLSCFGTAETDIVASWNVQS